AHHLLARRGGRSDPRPRLHPAGGSGSLPRKPRRARGARGERRLPPSPRLRGRPHARPLRARPRPGRHGDRPPRARGARLRARRARHPGPHRGRRLRRLRPPPDAHARRSRAPRAARPPRMSLPALELRSPLAAAYDHCEALTRRASSNFYWGFRLLPHERRRALSAVYAFCRAADDIADEPGAARDPERLLARWRAELEAVYAGRPRHPIGVALADTAERFALPREHFEAVIAGVRSEEHTSELQSHLNL